MAPAVTAPRDQRALASGQDLEARNFYHNGAHRTPLFGQKVQRKSLFDQKVGQKWCSPLLTHFWPERDFLCTFWPKKWVPKKCKNALFRHLPVPIRQNAPKWRILPGKSEICHPTSSVLKLTAVGMLGTAEHDEINHQAPPYTGCAR